MRGRGRGWRTSPSGTDMEEAELRSKFSGTLYWSRRIGELIEEGKRLGHISNDARRLLVHLEGNTCGLSLYFPCP